MIYKKLGNSDLNISAVGYGTWALGNDTFGEIDEDLAIKAINAGIDSGINLIDTAPGYGDGYSERIVGRAIEGKRDKVILATKCGLFRFEGMYVRCGQPALIRLQIENSLRNLKTDYIDLYQIHWPDLNVPLETTFEVLTDLKKEGKIRAIGVSNFNIEQIKTAIELGAIASVQPPLSILDRRSIDNHIISFCCDNNVGTLTYGSLAGGLLTGRFTQPQAVQGKDVRSKYYNYYQEPQWGKAQKVINVMKGIAEDRGVQVSEVAINWSLSQRGVSCALVGASKPYQAQANAKACDWVMTEKEVQEIDSVYYENFK
jgi:aryl-alcohol dehydrogenase-like predicted oxidoreductase